ncbi:hypothetical protein FNV43_RR14823 [Rhamnella rubrinervis]|uniref:Uncharacterized protein n=1 Tax=Rhamnella rubrinervis TaxID=2594499 RepID=A0A8K0MGR1_9ROSA|nr:hypothetical protein FNV43_RR14823 [Rhamnella rubrinervis]
MEVDLVQFVKERKKKDIECYKAKNEHWKLICSGQPLQRIRLAASAFRNYSSATKEMTMRKALNSALDEEMSADPRVFLMGEEVGEYQGAYKARLVGLSLKDFWRSMVLRGFWIHQLQRCKRVLRNFKATMEVGVDMIGLTLTAGTIWCHIKAVLKLAKLLHSKGFHVTFVNTEFNHSRFLKSLGPNSLDGLPDFGFETIPDGHPSSDAKRLKTSFHFVNPSEGRFWLHFLTSSPDSATVVLLSLASFRTGSSLLPSPLENNLEFLLSWCIQFQHAPSWAQTIFYNNESSVTNNYLDKVVDWIPGMKDMRVRDLPSFCWTRNTEEHFLFNFTMESAENAHKASAVILHTFYALEKDVLDALQSMFSHLFAIGPLQLLLNIVPEDPLKPVKYSLWKEESECLQLLDTKESNSAVYVNFGSMTPKHLVEFGMGLANSKHLFLWIIRPDLVVGESAILPPEFVNETKGRGLIAKCTYFLLAIHHGPTKYTCKELRMGMEINKDVKTEEVEKLVRDLMKGEKGKELKKNVMEWKRLAEDATSAPNGSSTKDLDDLVKHLVS